MITNDLSIMPTPQLHALALDVTGELLKRGVTVEEICHRNGISEDQFWTLLKFNGQEVTR